MEQQIIVKNEQEFKAILIKIDEELQYLRSLNNVRYHSSLYGYLAMAGYALSAARMNSCELDPFETTHY